MNAFYERRKIIQERFENDTHQVMLTFKDAKLEDKFQLNKAETLRNSRFFIISQIAVLVILAARRIELLIFALVRIQSISGNVQAEYIQFSLLLVVYAIEAIFVSADYFKKARGFLLMLYMFFVVTYSSFVYIPTPCSVPM